MEKKLCLPWRYDYTHGSSSVNDCMYLHANIEQLNTLFYFILRLYFFSREMRAQKAASKSVWRDFLAFVKNQETDIQEEKIITKSRR